MPKALPRTATFYLHRDGLTDPSVMVLLDVVASDGRALPRSVPVQLTDAELADANALIGHLLNRAMAVEYCDALVDPLPGFVTENSPEDLEPVPVPEAAG